MPRKVPHGTFQSVTDCNGFTRAFQTYASNASDVQMQVMCKCEFVALGGAGVDGETGRGTSVRSTSLLKNEQMANVLDVVSEGGNTRHD